MNNDKEQLYIEQAILSTVLLGGGIPGGITSSMFRFAKNATIFSALKELKKTCDPDLVILHNYLTDRGTLDEAGGNAYIAGLTNMLPSPSNANYYVGKLSESYYRRFFNSILSSTTEELNSGKPLDEILEQFPKYVEKISLERNRNKGKLKRGISFNDLVKKEFPLALWIVENLITKGLTLLIGGSKIGKSWLALQLAIAVDKGGFFLGSLPTQKLGIAYFALEDTEERIKGRLNKFKVEVFNDAWLETTWDHNPAFLKSFLRENPQYKVVIIDTLQQFARISDIKDYTETVNALGLLKRTADELGIAIIAIHHTRKGTDHGTGDWMDGGLGSIGINATADCTITLTRKRESSEGFLRATGRDIEETHWALKWDKELCSWSKVGDAPRERTLSAEQQELYQILKEEAPASVPTSKIAEKAGKSEGNTINILNRLVSADFVKKVGRGLWTDSKFTS